MDKATENLKNWTYSYRKGYSAFPKASALLEPHYQIAKCHIVGGVLPLRRDAVGVLMSGACIFGWALASEKEPCSGRSVTSQIEEHAKKNDGFHLTCLMICCIVTTMTTINYRNT